MSARGSLEVYLVSSGIPGVCNDVGLALLIGSFHMCTYE